MSDTTKLGGSITIGSAESTLTFGRMGYGAMQLTGPGVWDMPDDMDAAIALLRRAVDLGVTFIDTADSYGPHTNEELIRRALHPYDNVVVATKGGLARTGPNRWHSVGRPEYLRQCVELSLRRLSMDCIPLYQLHRVDDQVPLADQIGELAALREEGKIGHIGLSEVDVSTLEAASQIVPIVSVQNRYNVFSTGSASVLDYCENQSIAFIPWFPLKNKELALQNPEDAQRFAVVERIANTHGISVAQVALAWLLQKSPVMVPIPGTRSLAHLAENVSAANVVLSDDDMVELNALGRPD